ncbi:hypothetical protein HXV84_01740 [Pseudomonas amygdali pv. morsprunorum]|nr:hypothetical protein [Pseudomonas amygdali pv. morsprunorum]
MTGGPSYSRDGDINVRMRLGDFIDRGGKVYLDNSAAGEIDKNDPVSHHST